MNQQLKTALGDARYTEYQRSQDRTYDLLARLGARYDLPQETVLQAYDLQNSFNQPGGQPDRWAAAQKQLNDQLTAILGEQEPPAATVGSMAGLCRLSKSPQRSRLDRLHGVLQTTRFTSRCLLNRC